ncbi:protein of unknown function [Sinomicrobium oceani]|uniref:DUF202 domain-containing protein n=1 Tax=Sinomicrobium oceani TaxID=1150368 RepID=A0A1K1N1C6_9FLAO|nr:DUF202 domain-containing protein [Sinomicrobium oceani]SFW29242.1 protein of unknown function [Sinomicrobium oceani]
MVILKYYAIFNPEAGRNYSGNNLSEQPPHFAEKAIEQLLTMKKFVPFRKMQLLRFGRDFERDEEMILRDYLSVERTRLSNERTLLSYIRTFLYLILGGITFIQLDDFYNIRYLGILSLFLSVIFLFIGVYRFLLLKKSLKRFHHRPGDRKA